jgi:hypothetical protein
MLFLDTSATVCATASGTVAGCVSIVDLIQNWTHIGQALVGSIGALAFIFAFIWKITAVESKSALAAKQWIQRIVVGTIGVEIAGSLVSILTNSVPPAAH